MTDATITVGELLSRIQQAVVTGFPSPLWVRGEVSGFRRTSRGAAFFRLADPDQDDTSLEVLARGRVMADIDRTLTHLGIGGLRDGVGVRVRGTIGVDPRRSIVRLTLLEVDPAFTAGRLALDRTAVLEKMRADGSLMTNHRIEMPLVPLRVGLVTSRGSAAHGDFTNQLKNSGFRFRVHTAHTAVQGEDAAPQLTSSLQRFTAERVDVVVVVRGGGSKLDLSVFDTEPVARAIAGAAMPVITGIGHDMDRTVADEAAAVATKTPSSAGEWLVNRVKDYSDRIDRARHAIRTEARSALRRHHQLLRHVVSEIAGGATALDRESERLDRLRLDIARVSRQVVERQRERLGAYQEWFTAVDVDPTLKRGFAIVTRDDSGAVVRSTAQLAPGDRIHIRLGDGTVQATVEEK